MIDLNSLPIPGGALLAGIGWIGISLGLLGPLVAERTIEKAGWAGFCERNLRAAITEQIPERPSSQQRSCADTVGVMGEFGRDFCDLGGGILLDLMTIDPTSGAREVARQAEEERLNRLADQAPSTCSCAASQVASDRLGWGLHAGSARVLGGPEDLEADLLHALQAPRCSSVGQGFDLGAVDADALGSLSAEV